MKNIDMKVEGNFLIIKVDLTKDLGPSKSGKTIIIASTEGSVKVEKPPRDNEKMGGILAMVGLNVYKGR